MASLEINNKAKDGWFTLEELIKLRREGLWKNSSGLMDQKASEVVSHSGRYRDVHSYDGTLTGKWKDCRRSVQYKSQRLSLLGDLLIDPHAKLMLTLFRNHAEAGGGVDDTSNGIDSSALLVEILSQKLTIDIYQLLEEQLRDNYLLGACPQGRSTRLLQIYDLLQSGNQE